MTNAAAIGYMILAMKYLGYDVEAIKEMEREMYCLLDMRTEEEAEEVYNNF